MCLCAFLLFTCAHVKHTRVVLLRLFALKCFFCISTWALGSVTYLRLVMLLPVYIVCVMIDESTVKVIASSAAKAVGA